MKILLIWAAADWSIYDQSMGYKHAFEALGHDVKVFNTVRRIEFWTEALQHWGQLTGQTKAGIEQILREACDWALIEAAYYQPDLVLITSAMGFHPNAAQLLRAHGYHVAVAFSECPYDDDKHIEFAQAVDYVFVNDRVSVPRLSAVCPNTWYLGTAYDSMVHYPQEPLGSADVLFVGTGFPERQRLLAAVDWSGINLELWGFWDYGPATLQEALRPYVHTPITNDETARRYCGAKIGLNLYREGGGESCNPRAYELAACGTFQLAQDSSLEAHEIFGDTIAYFKDAADLERKIRYYLAHPAERATMAAEARARVLGHSYQDRVQTMLAHLGGLVGFPVAPKLVLGESVSRR